MVKQLYRPLVLYGILIISIQVLLMFVSENYSFTVGLVVFFAVVIFIGTIISMGIFGVKRFIKGLQTSGVHIKISSKEIGWMGEYQIQIETSEGPFYVESVIGNFLSIKYRGSHTFGWKFVSLFELHRMSQKMAKKIKSRSKLKEYS